MVPKTFHAGEEVTRFLEPIGSNRSWCYLPAAQQKSRLDPGPAGFNRGLNRLPGMFAWGLIKSLPYPKSRTSTERPY